MFNQLKNLTLIFALLFVYSADLIGQHSLPMGFDETEYNDQQKIKINELLTDTKTKLSEKLTRSNDKEYISKIIITNSYKFAKSYSVIMEKSSVPFKLVTSSTSFLGCWVDDNFIYTEGCWDEHLAKASGSKFSSLK